MAINKKHALLIFTEMILNDFKTQLQQIQAAGVMYPIVANIEMRPCLISVARRRLKSSTLPSAVKPAGSQKPTGAWTPSSFSNAVRVTWHENGILTALLHSAALLFFLLVFWKRWRLWRGQDHHDIIALITVNTTILISWLAYELLMGLVMIAMYNHDESWWRRWQQAGRWWQRYFL